eukprot:727504-Hanusia_phi.AAC.2
MIRFTAQPRLVPCQVTCDRYGTMVPGVTGSRASDPPSRRATDSGSRLAGSWADRIGSGDSVRLGRRPGTVAVLYSDQRTRWHHDDPIGSLALARVGNESADRGRRDAQL